jgi:hypothetical protein
MQHGWGEGSKKKNTVAERLARLVIGLPYAMPHHPTRQAQPCKPPLRCCIQGPSERLSQPLGVLTGARSGRARAAAPAAGDNGRSLRQAMAAILLPTRRWTDQRRHSCLWNKERNACLRLGRGMLPDILDIVVGSSEMQGNPW